MPVRQATGPLHIKSQKNDLYRSEKIGQIDGLITAVAAVVNLVFPEPFFTFPVYIKKTVFQGCPLVLRPKLTLKTGPHFLDVLIPPVPVASVKNVRP